MSGYPRPDNRSRIVKVLDVKRESQTCKTISFQDQHCAQAEAGQFIMVWIPDVDEIPMSISATSPDGTCSITAAEVGEATTMLHQQKVGDLLGIRGPYGNSFKPVDGRVLVVGGGSGLAPLTFLAEELAPQAAKIFYILGAKTRNELLFLRRIENTLSNASAQITAMTEDGSYGERGVATTAAKTILEKEKIDMIYTCGPELMMHKMLTLAEQYDTPLQASLERLMRCALGLCGSCVIGRFTVCKDGPVFSDEQLSEVKHEFGHFRRGASGKLVPLQS